VCKTTTPQQQPHGKLFMFFALYAALIQYNGESKAGKDIRPKESWQELANNSNMKEVIQDESDSQN
jgi:hypothetical protein